MHTFHHSFSAALDCPIAHAFALSDWSHDNDPWLCIKRGSPGYIAQEIAMQNEIQEPTHT
jgi:hypothetical protein